VALTSVPKAEEGSAVVDGAASDVGKRRLAIFGKRIVWGMIVPQHLGTWAAGTQAPGVDLAAKHEARRSLHEPPTKRNQHPEKRQLRTSCDPTYQTSACSERSLQVMNQLFRTWVDSTRPESHLQHCNKAVR
jgi:hypothetical protein